MMTMTDVCTPQEVLNVLSDLADTSAMEGGIQFPITEDIIINAAKTALEATGINATIDEIKNNIAMMNNYKIKLLELKQSMGATVKQVKELGQNMATNIAAVGTASAAGGYPNPGMGAASMKSLIDSFKSQLDSIDKQFGGIFSIAAELGIGVPNVILTSLQTLNGLKQSLTVLG